MSLISVKNTGSARNNNSEREPSEFDGIWLNIGITTKDEESGETNFVRLPRGVAVSDLAPKKIYDSMSPEFAAQVALENKMIAEIQNAARQLAEGESKATAVLDVQLYKRQEESDASEINDATPELNLFG